jgi:hypothetical protein
VANAHTLPVFPTILALASITPLGTWRPRLLSRLACSRPTTGTPVQSNTVPRAHPCWTYGPGRNQDKPSVFSCLAPTIEGQISALTTSLCRDYIPHRHPDPVAASPAAPDPVAPSLLSAKWMLVIGVPLCLGGQLRRELAPPPLRLPIPPPPALPFPPRPGSGSRRRPGLLPTRPSLLLPAPDPAAALKHIDEPQAIRRRHLPPSL